ncbi:MAG: FIVAR domain-containing protein [Clostridia bacterium]|nr:FIVAR domain-containing protein [Clostridia bacterium]
MKFLKRILVLFLTALLAVCTVVPAFAAAPSTATGRVGENVTITFTFDAVVGIEGEVILSNPDLFTSASLSATGAMVGGYSDGYFMYYSPTGDYMASTYTLILNVSENAKPGDTCTVTFEYTLSDLNGIMGEVKQDIVQVTIKSAPDLNFDELNEQIRIAESLKSTDYTSASWSALRTALTNAKNALKSTTQEGIDSATAALKTAIANLKPVTSLNVDYSELVKQIKIAEALNSKNYTAASWANLTKALNTAKAALKSESQTEVNSAATALKNAIASLVAVSNGIDYSELNKQIAIAEGLKKADYTANSWAALESALVNAIAARGSNNQATVDTAANALKNAISALVRVNNAVDYTELEKQIAIAEGLDESLYTDASWENLLEKLEAAKLAATGKDQAEVDAATAALKTAIADLVRMNYQALHDIIEAIKKHAEEENLSGLWLKMHELLEKAPAMFESGDQAEVDAYVAQLSALLAEIIREIESLKDANQVIVDDPQITYPTDPYCNIGMHRVWPILFWISFALNLGTVAVVVYIYINKRKKTSDNTPLVDYDIADDAE